jgi:hypothetical protein
MASRPESNTPQNQVSNPRPSMQDILEHRSVFQVFQIFNVNTLYNSYLEIQVYLYYVFDNV